MAVRGVFTSHSGLIGERGTDLSARVLTRGPAGQAPLLALSSGMPNEPATQTSYSWIEDEHISGNQTVVTGGSATETVFTVDSVGIWTRKTILMNEDTGEYMFIIDLTDTTITVRRGHAGSVVAPVVAGQKLQSLGTAHAEGSGRPEPVTQRGEEYTNYVQIFKNAWAITGTAKAVKFITGSQMARDRQQCFAYHAEDIERAFLWGRKSVGVLDGEQLRTSHGILAQIQEYGGLVEAATNGGNPGEYSMRQFQHFMRRIFDKNIKGEPNERIAFTGSGLLEVIQHMVMIDSSYDISVNETAYGIQVTTIRGFNGQLKLVTHPLMVENEKWSHELYVIHPGGVKKRTLRPTWNEEFTAGRQNNNGKDADEGYIAVEMGFETRGAACMGILTNVQEAVPSFPS